MRSCRDALRDTNLRDIAKHLGLYGVDLCEARVVPDVEEEIVTSLNHLRERYDYVITTGGIGPTHDDITADSVAAALRCRALRTPRHPRHDAVALAGRTDAGEAADGPGAGGR